MKMELLKRRMKRWLFVHNHLNTGTYDSVFKETLGVISCHEAYNIYLKLALRPYILEKLCLFFKVQIYIREQDLAYWIWPRFSMAGRLLSHLSARQKRNKTDFLCSSFNSGHWLTTNKCLTGLDFVPSRTIISHTSDADAMANIVSPNKYSLVLNLQVNTSHPHALYINFWDRHKSNTAYLILMQCLMRAKVCEPFYVTTGSRCSNSKHVVSWRQRREPARVTGHHQCVHQSQKVTWEVPLCWDLMINGAWISLDVFHSSMAPPVPWRILREGMPHTSCRNKASVFLLFLNIWVLRDKNRYHFKCSLHALLASFSHKQMCHQVTLT